MNKLLLFFRILTLFAALALTPLAFSQQDSIDQSNPDRFLDSPQACVVFVTGDFESECILPFEKPGAYLNEEGTTLIACQDMEVTYTAHLAGNANAVAWSWYVSGAVTWINNGDGTITVNWGSDDTGTIYVEVTDAEGNICSVERAVLLMERPTAIVNTIPPYVVENGQNIVYVCRGESVEFIDESTLDNGDIAGYYWRNGWSGASSSSQNFVVSDVMDEQEVIHRVYNNCGCYDSVLFKIRVRDGKPLELGCYGTVCAGQEVTYTAISPECNSYAWTVDGGSIIDGSNSATFTVRWDNTPSGYGVIELEGSLCADWACPALMTKKIPILTGGLAISGQRIVCVGETADYSLPLYGSTEYRWSVSPSGGVIVHEVQANRRVLEFRREGTYQIYVDYDCEFLDCRDLHSDTLTVFVKPRLSIDGDNRICKGSPCNIHTLPAGTVANWTVRDSVGTVIYTGSGDILPFSFDTLRAGKYRITAENDDFCHSSDHILTIIDTPPTPSIDGNPSVTCPYSSILLSGEPSEPSYSLVWRPQCSGASPQSVSGNEVTINYGNEVCDVAVYNYDRITGCLSAQPYTHHVTLFQLADYNVGPYTVCPGSPVSLAAPPQDNVIYEWQLDEYKQYCASVQGDVYSHSADLWVNELTGAGAYPTTFDLTLYRTYCSTLRDTVTISLTVTDSIGSMSIDTIGSVCQGEAVPLHGDCSGDDYHWSISGCEYYTLSGNSVTFDEPGVFTATLNCNPYDFCHNSRYTLSASTSVHVHPLPPFVALLFADGNVSTFPTLSEDEYSFHWGHTTDTHNIVSMTSGVELYTCEITRREFPGCSRTIEAVADTMCQYVGIDFNGFNYCDRTATFSLSDVPATAQVLWYVSGGEYASDSLLEGHETVVTIPFARLGDYLIQAYATYEGQCYRGYYTITVDFLPSFDIIKHCTALELRNNSHTLTGEGDITVSCDGTLYTFPVTQSSIMISNLSEGEHTFSLVTPNGVGMPCTIGTVTVQNTGGALLTVETEYGDQQACENTALKLIVQGVPEPDIENVSWAFSDGSAFSTGTNTLYHTFRQGNWYQVTATLVDANGCSSYGTLNLSSISNDLKNPLIEQQGDITCPGNGMQLHYTTDHGDYLNPAYYQWNDGEYTLSDNHFVYSTGDYKVTATDDNHCKAMAMANVPFKNQPQAVIVTDGSALCERESITFYGSPDPNPENYDFVWRIQRNGSVVDSSVNHNMEYTPSQPGTYTVSLSITNSEDCSDNDSYTFTVSPRPPKPTIDFAGNQCIDQPPVNLMGSNYSGELHWSNGHVGNTANYYVPGTATAWYYDAVSGCRSNDENIYITPAPNFDALLTGCYNICKSDLPNLSPLRVWGLMPIYQSYHWHWLLNGGEIVNGSHSSDPLELQLTEFGDYQLVVAYNNDQCNVKSPLLTLHDSCICNDLDVAVRVTSTRIKDCRIHYNVHVTVCNNSDKKVCLKTPPVLVDNASGVVVEQMNFHQRTLGPGECYTFLIKLSATRLGDGTVSFRLYDDCNDCTKDFTVDLTGVNINCDGMMRVDRFRLVPHVSTQPVMWFNFRALLPPVQSVLYFWADPDIVTDYNFFPFSNVMGLAGINADTLLRMASHGERICFHAIVCTGRRLCKLHYCIRAKELYSMLMHSRSDGAKGTVNHSEEDDLQPLLDGERLTLHPNPASGMVTVTGQGGSVSEVVIIDMQGRRVVSFADTDRFDVSSLPAGQYIVRVTTTSSQSDDSTLTQSSSQSFSQSEGIHYLKLIKK